MSGTDTSLSDFWRLKRKSILVTAIIVAIIWGLIIYLPHWVHDSRYSIAAYMAAVFGFPAALIYDWLDYKRGKSKKAQSGENPDRES